MLSWIQGVVFSPASKCESFWMLGWGFKQPAGCHFPPQSLLHHGVNRQGWWVWTLYQTKVKLQYRNKMETLISVIGRQKQKLTDRMDGRGNWRTEDGKIWVSQSSLGGRYEKPTLRKLRWKRSLLVNPVKLPEGTLTSGLLDEILPWRWCSPLSLSCPSLVWPHSRAYSFLVVAGVPQHFQTQAPSH